MPFYGIVNRHTSGGKMAHILVLEDNDMVRKTLCNILTRAGHVVRDFETGLEGIRFLRKNEIDLLITDIFMPDKDGLEVLKELQEQRAHFKIIAITGGGRNGNMNFLPVAKRLGAHATLNKPFLRNELSNTVDRVLNMSESVN